MANAWTNYAERARQLLMDAVTTAAFIALNEYADTAGHCPSCGDDVGRYESDRCTHARLCRELRDDAERSARR